MTRCYYARCYRKFHKIPQTIANTWYASSNHDREIRASCRFDFHPLFPPRDRDVCRDKRLRVIAVSLFSIIDTRSVIGSYMPIIRINEPHHYARCV